MHVDLTDEKTGGRNKTRIFLNFQVSEDRQYGLRAVLNAHQHSQFIPVHTETYFTPALSIEFVVFLNRK